MKNEREGIVIRLADCPLKIPRTREVTYRRLINKPAFIVSASVWSPRGLPCERLYRCRARQKPGQDVADAEVLMPVVRFIYTDSVDNGTYPAFTLFQRYAIDSNVLRESSYSIPEINCGFNTGSVSIIYRLEIFFV